MAERLFKLAGALLLMGSLVLGWFWMGYENFAAQPLRVGESPKVFEVAPGASLGKIAEQLEAQGLTNHPRYFVWMGRLHGLEHAIQAGEYEIKPGTKPRELLDQMAAGRVLEHSLTLVEGWNFQEVMAAVNADADLAHTLSGLAAPEIMARLGWPDEHPEGRFLPETYNFPRGTTDAEFLRRAHVAMSRELEAAWKKRAPDLPLKSPYEALTLASIIEKETALPEERRAIAGVFIRRLERGMRLQTDPTVIYGLGTKFDGNLRRKDLKRDTPYNTYMHRGLPPTPIAMPGRDALNAAVHPEEGNVLYFVSRGDGSHHFSATLEEHNRAVIKYQLNGHTRSFSSNP